MLEHVFVLFDEFDFILSNITTIVLLLTLASLLLANLARYVQAKKYGIPLKMVHQAGIPDSLDIWVTLISVLGFGMFMPWLMLSVSWHGLVIFAVTFVSCFLGVASTKVRVGRTIKDKDGTTRDVSYSLVFAMCLALLVAIGLTFINFAFAHGDYYEAPRSIPQVVLIVLAVIMLSLYALVIVLCLVGDIHKKIYGNQDILTVEIGSQMYLIAMRHVTNYWVLIPCYFDKVEPVGDVYIGDKKPEERLIDAIKFTKGRFIVKDISLLDDSKSILCREKYVLVGVKE